jgi:hypothetical protein
MIYQNRRAFQHRDQVIAKMPMSRVSTDPSLWLSGTCVGVIVAVMIAAMVML